MKIISEEKIKKIIDDIKRDAREAIDGEIEKVVGSLWSKDGKYYDDDCETRENSLLLIIITNIITTKLEKIAIDQIEQKVLNEGFIDEIIERINRKQLK